MSSLCTIDKRDRTVRRKGMGASNSHETAQATPPRRILNIDPRSPSCDISRTPIVVDKTPEYSLDDLDPRSPTVGIVRTPLSLLAQAKQDKELLDVPKLDLEEDTGEDQVQEEEEQAQTTELLGVTGIENISLDDFPTSESTRLVPFVDEPADKEKIKVKKQKPRSTQPKELFPSRKKSHPLETATRSPLSTRSVNTDSPLQMVQRKQIKDIDLKRNCGLESTTSRYNIVKDKENL